LEHVPQPHQQVELSHPPITLVGVSPRFGDLGFQAPHLSGEDRITGGVAARLGDVATDSLELGEEAIGSGVTLTQPGELEPLSLEARHGARCGASLTDDAGGKEELSDFVSVDRLSATEVGQVDGEHRSEKRFVSTTQGPAQIVLRRITGVRAPYPQLLLRARVALDLPQAIFLP